jgi:hypothetical protein
MYLHTVKFIAKQCEKLSVHIEEIPAEILKLMEHKTPTGSEGLIWNYESD